MADCGFQRDAHVQFFARMLQGLPSMYQGQECNRLSLAYFAVSALDILDALDQIPATEVVDWVYSLQVLPTEADTEDGKCGFRGSASIGFRFSPLGAATLLHDGGHLAMTYSALAILRILGDDCSRVCRNAIVKSMRLLQQSDGSFTPVSVGAEKDMRFVFCAAAISTMLEDWSGMDVQLTYDYIVKCQSYDGGVGLSPGLESHGGATYCAVATLKLMENSGVDSLPSQALDIQLLADWLVQRQVVPGGFQGRINKDADTCYAFWVGASLNFVGAYDACDRTALRLFLLSCQSEDGGFSKFPDCWVDALHSYYAVCGFSLLNEPGLNVMCCELGMSARAADGLKLSDTASDAAIFHSWWKDNRLSND